VTSDEISPRAASLHEEVGPLGDRGVAVEVEEVALNALHHRGARFAVQLLA
jgi:hypothetical protein